MGDLQARLLSSVDVPASNLRSPSQDNKNDNASDRKTLATPGARGEREGYGGPRDVTSLSLSKRGENAIDETTRNTRNPQITPPRASPGTDG